MALRQINKPLMGEFAPYTIMYIGLLPDDGQVLQHLQAGPQAIRALLAPFTEPQLTTPCAPGEWTLNEILLHIIDDERIYAYRALRAARADLTELPGFEPDDFARYSEANSRSLESLLAEYDAVRLSTIALFEHLPQVALTRASVSNGNRMSVRAAAYHIAGHERHHIDSIKLNYLG